MIQNNKILIVDDNPPIHQDFKIALQFRSVKLNESISSLENNIFGKNANQKNIPIQFDLQHAYSIDESLTILREAKKTGVPIAIIFMDIRMPPGMDGITASKLILEKYPQTEIVLCSGFLEYTHEEILGKFGLTDHILLLKKPFDFVEVRQLSIALMQRWNLTRELEQYTSNLEEEVKIRTKDLEDALTQVKKSDLAKTNFLSLMSHEIRNPINSIVGLIDLIQKSNDSKEKDNYVHLTQKASQTLLELVNDVLDLSKIGANQLVLENNPIDLPFLIDQLVSTFGHSIYKKGIELFSNYPVYLPEKVYGDSSRIKQILSNFITNASKFTPDGYISLCLEYKRININKAIFVFKVTDTGIGITENDQKRLFTDYSQINDGLPYNILGTGLGLSISRKLATLMNGDVGVQSKKGQGSTFWLEIQLNVSQNDSCIVDMHRVPNNLGVLVISNSETTNSFFKFYTKELKIDKNCFFISDNIEISNLHKNISNSFEVLHVFFDSKNFIHEIDIITLKKISKNKLVLHSIVPLLLKSAEHFQNQHLNIPISKPLLVKDFYELISIYPTLEQNGLETYSDALDEKILDKIKSCKILLVDDDPMALLITSTNLKNFGFNVYQAESSDLAIEYHKKFKFDLIFMDLMLNGSNGIETTQKIRALAPPLNQTYVIALTANAFIEDKQRCIEGGMDDFLTKPLSPNSLYEVVMDFILNKFVVMNNKQIDLQEILPSVKEVINAQVYEYLDSIYGFKKEQILKILQISKSSLKETLKEIETALNEKNQKLLGILFHRIKGSLKNIGLSEPSEWAKEVEINIFKNSDLTNAENTLIKLKAYLEPFLS